MRLVKYPYCQKVLPLAYDDSLSYYESICKLVNKMNEIITEMNELDVNNILNRVDEKIDKELETLYKQMDNLTANVNQVMGNVNNSLELYHQQVIRELNATTANLTNFVNVQLLTLRKYIDGQDNMILSELRYQIELLKNSLPDLTTVYVKSPYTGKIITIQEAIDELWNNLRVYSLTADEYDRQGWTAQEYDNFNLTAYQYDYYAKRFIYKDPELYMFSPFTGEFVFYQEVIMGLVELHRTKAITASDYDTLALTANAYDDKDVTAYTYDWDGYSVLTGQQPIVSGNVVLDPNSDGLTAYEQSKLAIKI